MKSRRYLLLHVYHIGHLATNMHHLPPFEFLQCVLPPAFRKGNHFCSLRLSMHIAMPMEMINTSLPTFVIRLEKAHLMTVLLRGFIRALFSLDNATTFLVKLIFAVDCSVIGSIITTATAAGGHIRRVQFVNALPAADPDTGGDVGQRR